MCTTCGCGEGETRVDGQEHGGAGHSHSHHHVHAHGHSHDHPHDPGHSAGSEGLHFGLGPAHSHAPGTSQARRVQVEQDILAKNDGYAAENRRYFREHGVFALNLVSSPGSGKTTLLLRTIERLQGRIPLAVIEGDQQTSRDAERIRGTGLPAVQINTGKGCHLDAHMVGHALERLRLQDDSVLFIENVGNLVCPAAFDLGEAHKVVVLSVTEGEDKPIKYPDMFRAADLMLLNKVDLLPYVDFDVERCAAYAARVRPDIQKLELSATRGDGMEPWCAWLEAGWQSARAARVQTLEGLRRRNEELESELAALRARLAEQA
jgi:hydrogenase nickel incorporation protein HypB